MISSALVVVVPAYNAGERLRPVLDRLLPIASRIIVVDDGSTDGATRGLEELPIQLERHETNRGKGHALVTGFRAALEDPASTCVATLDADGQHDPAELPGLYERFLAEDADLVIGSRVFNGPGVPLRSRIGNTVTIAVVGWLLGQRVPDTQSGYRLHSRRFLEAVLPSLGGGRYETEMEMLARAIGGKYRVVAAPIRTIYEKGNPSSHFNKLRDSYRIYASLIRASRRK